MTERAERLKTQALKTWWECSACRGDIDEDDRFCRHCGAELA